MRIQPARICVDDQDKAPRAGEFDRLGEHGVRFTQEPIEMRHATAAVFDDSCGNLRQIRPAAVIVDTQRRDRDSDLYAKLRVSAKAQLGTCKMREALAD